MNLVNHLAERAIKHPDRIALADSTRSITYTDLYSHVCAGAQKLLDEGLKAGDVILILQPVGIPLYITLLSVFHAGMTVMFIDPSADKQMIKTCLQIQKPHGFIGILKAHLLRLTISEIREIKHHYHSNGWLPLSRKWAPKKVPHSTPSITKQESPALITFTSGSTGKPKATCRTHHFLLAQHKALAASLNYQEGEVDLITLPVFALANLVSGLTSVIADTDLSTPAKANSQAIFNQCERYNVTRCAASPSFFQKLLEDDLLPNFSAIYTGGAPVFPNLLENIQTAFPAMDVVIIFGSTEAEPISHIRWSDISAKDKEGMFAGKGLLVGTPVDATFLKIIPDQSGKSLPTLSSKELNKIELSPGKIGEIIVTGEHVLKGYLHGQGDEENKIQVGHKIWHRTGDAACKDELGRIWLVGRCSARIKNKNNTVIYPFGIECVAMSHPAIKRCAMVEYQQEPTLIVQGILDDIQKSSLLDKLLPLGVKNIQLLPVVPVDKRHNAKIDYPLLMKLLEDNQ